MAVEKKEFQTEVSQLLNIVIHSLYSNKEIFLRELISNASDAIDKARYEGITNSAINEGGTDWSIKVIPNKDKNTLTIKDNGIGMNRDEVIRSLGTIAHSGTKEFLQKVAESGRTADINNLIGQFGVGFYSAYMVADKVTVYTRRRGEPAEKGVKWESDAQSSYTIEEIGREEPGTEIILQLKDDEKTLLSEWTLRRIITSYSDYIEYPVKMDISKPIYDSEGKATDQNEIVEETINSQKAIWLKDKAEITEEEQNAFYKHITGDFSDPAKVIQIKAEGTSEFYAMLFLPKHAPFDLFNRDTKYGPMLYVKRVQIMEHCEEILPQYLRFVTGVVDSSDLPLNISREILQNNRQVAVINKNITRKILDTLAEMQLNEQDNYKLFYEEFGKVLKEGIHYDFERREAIAKLCLFESTETKEGAFTTLEEYFSRMKSDQKDIYYITGGSKKEMENSPYLEGIKAKGYEVLFMPDEFDDIIFSTLGTFKEKNLKSVLKGDLDIDDQVKEKKAKAFEDIVSKIKEALGDKVESVRLTTRLKDSPVCLVTGEGAPNAQMERLLKAMGQPVPKVTRTMELNPDHELIKAMKKELVSDPDKLKEYAELLYDQAVLLEGGKIDNVAEFVKKISKLMAKNI